MKTHIDKLVPSQFHEAITLPGWWFSIDDDNLVRVRRVGRYFVASVYDVPSRWLCDRSFKMQHDGRGVLGMYPTVDAARKAAVFRVQCEGVPKVCTWKDVVEARKLVRHQEMEAHK